MMTYQEFVERTKKEVQEALPGIEVQVQEVNKLQNASYVGIALKPENSAVTAVLDVRTAFEQYQMDESRLGEILRRIENDARKAAHDFPVFDPEAVMEYGRAKEHLLMQVVPLEANRQMLEGLPHKVVEDIAVVYRVEIPADREPRPSTLVTNELLGHYGITPEQLHEDAVAAQTEHHPPVLKNLAEVMGELTGMRSLEESPMWVASFDGGPQGAAVFEVPDFMAQAAERLGGNFFVLPSSVHEVLLIPDDGSYKREQLEEMVRGVNATEVSEAEFLSDNVYHYDSVGKVFEMARTFENRVAEQRPAYETDAPETVKETMTVLLVEPEKYPRLVEISDKLEALQQAVGGYIEVTYPFEDNVGLVMNEEGKLEGLPLNRALRDDKGMIYDVIAGPFLVVGLTEEGFTSLSREQMAKFEELFHQPQAFVRMGKGLISMPIPDETIRMREKKAAQKAQAQPAKKPVKEAALG